MKSPFMYLCLSSAVTLIGKMMKSAISNEHKRGITEFSSTTLKHISDDEKTHKNERAYYRLENSEDGRRKKFF